MNTIARSLAAASALALAFGTTNAADPSSSERSAYNTTREEAQKQFKIDEQACSTMSGNAKDVCQAEAKARRDIAIADAEARLEGTPKARAKAARERSEANYRVAKERCDDFKGNDKDVCEAKAKAERDKGIAVADAGAQTADAREDVTRARREADYKVAKERCDALTGNAKDTCLADAKARFGM